MRLGSLGPVELILIVLAIVLIFGASKLGDIGGALGKSIKEFKKESSIDDSPKQTAATDQQPPAPVVTAPPPEKTPAVGVGDYRPPDAKAL